MIGTNLGATFLSLNKFVNILTNAIVVDISLEPVETFILSKISLGGALIAFAGAHLSTAVNANFFREMSAGRGYLALAAMIFGKWHPKTALVACLLFGFTDALQIRLQGVELPAIGTIPVQLIQAVPYILTVVLLAFNFNLTPKLLIF